MPAPAATAAPLPRTVGEQRMIRLDSVQPNGWNPNQMTPEVLASLKHGLLNDGWLASQALLVWASDENDKSKLVIIDGEHRWRAAQELGFVEGPAVFLYALTEAKAKALTVGMNQKRGSWNEQALAQLLGELAVDKSSEALALDLGFTTKGVDALLASLPKLNAADVLGEPASDGAERDDKDTGAKLGAVKYVVVIDCKDEQEQAALFERFKGEGLAPRLVMA